MLPILRDATGKPFILPKPRKGWQRMNSLEEFLVQFSDLKDLVVDATEQTTRRPKKAAEQRRHFSGKRKRHTLKTQLLVRRRTGRILHVSETVPGSIHDKTLLEQSEVLTRLPRGAIVRGDLGYLGIAKDHPRLDIRLPRRKWRGRPRRTTDIHRNRTLARQRIVVEYTIQVVAGLADRKLPRLSLGSFQLLLRSPGL